MVSVREREKLLEHARAAANAAYCPFSKFRVGAAVLADGQIFQGANVENQSFGLTICAERTAIFNAVTNGHQAIAALAVTCPDASESAMPAIRMPCGACRQVIAEFSSANTVIIVDGVGDFRVTDLLPDAFHL